VTPAELADALMKADPGRAERIRRWSARVLPDTGRNPPVDEHLFDPDVYQTRPWLVRKANPPPARAVAANDGTWSVLCRRDRPPHPDAHQVVRHDPIGLAITACGLAGRAIAIEADTGPVHPCLKCESKLHRAAS
jgi:hypothetical protein